MDDKYESYFAWYTSQKKGKLDLRLTIQSMLAKETDRERRAELHMLLGIESIRLDDISGNIDACHAAVEEFPEDPLRRSALAGAYSFLSFDFKRALEEMDAAVDVARRTNQFRRQVLHSKARLLRDMKDFRGLERCLLEIMSEPRSATADVAKEDDFIQNLPFGAISGEVLKAYAEFMAR